MKTLKLTAKDFKKSNSYWSDYVGKTDVSDYEGNIEIAGSLGYVRFDSISAKGYIVAEAGSGIEAGWGIKAGEGIKAGSGIISGLSITCKLVLSFKYRLFAGVAWYRDSSNEDKTITCGKLEGGKVCYGDVNETGLPETESNELASESAVDLEDEIILNGVTYVRKAK